MKTIKHSLGWIPDVPDIRDLELKMPMRAVRAASLKPVCDDIRPLIASVKPYDQGAIGSCTGNMGAAAVVVQQARQKKKLDTPSRLALYYDARVLQGWQNSDTGAYIRDIFKVLQKLGAGGESLHPYKERDLKKKPSAAYYAAAAKQQALKYERVPQTLSQMKAVLAGGNPINLGFAVYESIADAAVDGILNLPQPGERAEGGHAVLVVGYTNDLKAVHSRGGRLSLPKFAKSIPEWFIVRNSWGTNWGDRGYCYIPASYLTNSNLCADLWRLLLLE